MWVMLEAPPPHSLLLQGNSLQGQMERTIVCHRVWTAQPGKDREPQKAELSFRKYKSTICQAHWGVLGRRPAWEQ